MAIRWALIGVLPVLILVVSPQRIALSLLASGLYFVVALILSPPTRAERPLLGYAVLVAGFIAFSLFRSDFIDHLNADQQAYAASKAFYFVVALIPLSVAVSLLIPTVDRLKPAAWGQLALGTAVALVTIALKGQHFLGESRYTDQGNLIALGLLLAVQMWLVRRLLLAAALGVVGVAGVMLDSARQSLVVVVAGLTLSAAYWAIARLRIAGGVRRAVLSVQVLLPIALLLLLSGWLWFTLHPILAPAPRAQNNDIVNPCHCLTDRLVYFANDQGDRGLLLEKGLHLFVSQPIVGAGLGSYAGLVTGHPYPHNVPLEVAGELGVVGLLIIFGPLVWGWVRLSRAGLRTGSASIATLLALVVGFFVISNFAGDIPSQRGFWLFGILAMRLGLAAHAGARDT